MTNGVLARIDALAKAEGGLSDQRLEAILLAEQEAFEAAEERTAERCRSAASSAPAATSKSAAAPTDAQIYGALLERATEEYSTLSTPAAVEKWVLANPDAYTEYRKAEHDTVDPEAVAAIEERLDQSVAAGTADIRLMDMIKRFRQADPRLTKSAATVEVMKTQEARRLYTIRASGRPPLAERETRQNAIKKAEGDWEAAVGAARATLPGASESAILEAALRKHGTDAGAAATERQQLIAQLHELALTYQREHPETTYEASYARVCQQGIGYHISQMLKK